MFDSGMTASELIKGIEEEADIAVPVSKGSYISWLNSVEQLLYTEIIKEQGEATIDVDTTGFIDIGVLAAPNQCPARFEDIHAVYADEIQLIYSTLASGTIFDNTYYKIDNGIGLNIKKQPKKIKIIYFVKPTLKKTANIETEHVMVPAEFIDLVKAKLRGEAYKAVNEDSLAAKWINDYNILLETFKAWVLDKRAGFGV